jgi:diguanylate cyclase
MTSSAAALVSSVDFDYASSMATRALELMAEHKVPATPQNFEVWFTFVRGTMPELNKTINILLSSKRGLDDETNRSLFLNYIGAPPDWSAKQTQISAELHKVLEEAQEFLASTLSDNRKQVEDLGAVASQIEDNIDPRTIVQALMQELAKSMARASALEAQFTASLHALDNVRDRLVETEERAKIDPLTGLANRVALDEFIRRSQMTAMETGAPLSVLLMDVDHFKTFNDKFGHQFGDEVLRLVANVLRKGLRETDLAVRYGGEELLGILPNADLAVCATVAERIRDTIFRRQIRRRKTGEILGGVTVSIGVAQFVPGEPLGELIARCDRALYAAKRVGRNRTMTERDLSDSAAA